MRGLTVAWQPVFSVRWSVAVAAHLPSSFRSSRLTTVFHDGWSPARSVGKKVYLDKASSMHEVDFYHFEDARLTFFSRPRF